MRIPKHNWDTQQLEYTEYPNDLFEPFLVWLLTTSAWREDPTRVELKVRALERDMAAYRQPPDSHREAEAFEPAAAVGTADAPVAPVVASKPRRRARKAVAHAEA